MSSLADDVLNGLLTPGVGAAAGGTVGDVAVDSLLGTPQPQPQQEKKLGLIQTIKAAIEGNAEFDFTELPPAIRGIRQEIRKDPTGRPVKGASLGGLLGLEPSPEGKLNIFKKFFPDAEKKTDKNGNLYVTMPDGKNFYLDRPGFSRADIDEIINAGFFSATIGAGATMGGAALLGGAGRLGGALVGETAASVAQQSMSQEAGSGQGIDPFDAIVQGLFGAAGEGVSMALPTVSRVVRDVFTSGGYDPATRALTPEASTLLRNVGVDTDKITSDVAERINELAKASLDPAAGIDEKGAARLAKAATLPEPVPLTKGDVTRSPRQQAFEDMAEKGALGEVPEAMMRGKREAQQTALAKNVDVIAGQVGGGQRTVANVGEGAERARQGLLDVRAAAKAQENAAFDIARSKRATINKGAAETAVKGRIVQALDERDFDLDALPRVKSALDFLDKKIAADEGEDVAIGTLEKWRRNAVKAAANTQDQEARLAIRTMIDAYDDTMDDIFTRSILEGDDDAIDAWVAARLETTRFKEMFQSGDLVEKLTDPNSTYGPDDAARLLLGSGKLGQKIGLGPEVQKIREILTSTGRNAEWNAIREESFLRLLRTQRTGNVRGADLERLFSGDKFASEFDSVMEGSRDLMQAIFSKEELRAMQQLRDVALIATNKVKGGQNTSNSATSAVNILGRLGPSVQTVLDRFAAPFKRAQDVIQTRQAIDPLSRVKPGVRPKTGIGAAVGGTLGEQQRE